MNFTLKASLIALPLLLAACAQPSATTPVTVTPPVALSPELLGYVEVTAGKQSIATQSVQWVTPTADGFVPLALAQVPLNLQLHGDQNVTWSFDNGKTRYLATTLDVRNVSSTPQDTKNVYFLAVDTPQTIGDTAISAIVNDDGQKINDVDVARHIFPTHGVIPPGKVELPSADFVAFAEDEIASLKPIEGDVLFPWGFGVRHCLNAVCDQFNRNIPASDAKNSYDAIVTFAFQAPVGNSAKTPDAVRAVYAVYKDVGANPRLSQSLQEQAAGTVAGLPSIPSGFWATKFPGSTLAGGGWLSNLRISGTPSNPTSLMLPPSTSPPIPPTPPADPCPGASGTIVTCFGDNSPGTTGGAFPGQHGESFIRSTRDTMRVDSQSRILLAGWDAHLNGYFDSYTFNMVRYNPDGLLDKTFGDQGTVATLVGSVNSRKYITDVVYTPEGKILVVGGDFTLARYSSDGILDPTFGVGGVAKTVFASSTPNAEALVVALAPDGKIVVAGKQNAYADAQGTQFLPSETVITRYNASGNLDQTFGNSGKVVLSIQGRGSVVDSVVVTPNGKIIVAGSSMEDESSPSYAFIASYDADGRKDNTFGASGNSLPNFGGAYTGINKVKLTSDGKLLVLGFTDLGVIVINKYTLAGVPDKSFGTNGSTVLYGIPLFKASALAITNDGKIVVTGGELSVVRLTSSGFVDESFANKGIVTLKPGLRAGTTSSSIAITPNNKILVLSTWNFNVTTSIMEINP